MQLIGHSKSPRPVATRMSGFTLLEVMIALFVTSIGLLGIAKLQAVAYASTSTASARSLVAIQAAGLAAAMHANRNYWAAGAQPSPITISGTPPTIAESTNTLNTTATATNYCVSIGSSTGAGVPCTNPTTLAAFDLHTWAAALSAMMPNSSPVTTITCPVTIPISCTIVISWNEKAVAANTQAASGTVQGASVVSNDTFNPTYTLYVEP